MESFSGVWQLLWIVPIFIVLGLMFGGPRNNIPLRSFGLFVLLVSIVAIYIFWNQSHQEWASYQQAVEAFREKSWLERTYEKVLGSPPVAPTTRYDFSRPFCFLEKLLLTGVVLGSFLIGVSFWVWDKAVDAFKRP